MIFKTFWRRGTSSKRNFGKVWSLLCFFSWSLFSHSNYYIYRYIDMYTKCFVFKTRVKKLWNEIGNDGVLFHVNFETNRKRKLSRVESTRHR